jgi:hypothetical protein
LGCLGGCSEDGSRVFAQQLQPVGDILRVPELSLNVEVSAQERRAQLGYQLLSRICPGARAVVKLPVQSMLGARPVRQLVECRCEVVLVALKVIRWWEPYQVHCGHVVRPVATVVDTRMRRVDERQRILVGVLDEFGFWRLGKTVDLRLVKDRVGSQHRDATRLVVFFAFLDGELPGEDDGGADFALADVRIEGQGLPVGEPACGRVSACLPCMPENKGVDAAILPTRNGVLGHDAALGARLPRFHPCSDSSLEVFDNGAGDSRVQLVKLHATLLRMRFACNCLTRLRGAYLALFIFDTTVLLDLLCAGP